MLTSIDTGAAATTAPVAPPDLPRITTPVRELDQALWSLLLKPGRLSAAEWALIEAYERAGV